MLDQRISFGQDYVGTTGTVTRTFSTSKKFFNLINGAATTVTVNIIPYPVQVKTTVDATSAAGQKVLNVASTEGWEVGDTVTINRAGARYEVSKVDTIQDGVSLTLIDNLASEHTLAQADVVEKTNMFTCLGSQKIENMDPGNFRTAILTATGAYSFNVGA